VNSIPKKTGLGKIAQVIRGEKILEPELSHPPHSATCPSTHIFFWQSLNIQVAVGYPRF